MIIELDQNDLNADLERRISLETTTVLLICVLWSLNKSSIDRLQKTRRGMERKIVKVKPQDHIPHMDIRKRSKGTNVK